MSWGLKLNFPCENPHQFPDTPTWANNCVAFFETTVKSCKNWSNKYFISWNVTSLFIFFTILKMDRLWRTECFTFRSKMIIIFYLKFIFLFSVLIFGHRSLTRISKTIGFGLLAPSGFLRPSSYQLFRPELNAAHHPVHHRDSKIIFFYLSASRCIPHTAG